MQNCSNEFCLRLFKDSLVMICVTWSVYSEQQPVFDPSVKRESSRRCQLSTKWGSSELNTNTVQQKRNLKSCV
jgi:hypothetical protein